MVEGSESLNWISWLLPDDLKEKMTPRRDVACVVVHGFNFDGECEPLAEKSFEVKEAMRPLNHNLFTKSQIDLSRREIDAAAGESESRRIYFNCFTAMMFAQADRPVYDAAPRISVRATTVHAIEWTPRWHAFFVSHKLWPLISVLEYRFSARSD